MTSVPITIPFGDLKRQHDALRPALEAAMSRVLASGYYILGPEVRSFEEEFAAYCQARFCIGVGNGTEAIYLALTALGIGPGDEVICVANAAVYEVLTILQTGARPVFVDVDASHTLDPQLLEAAITPRTKAIVPVHLYGRPADMPAIMAIADAHQIPVIEDCAQSHGATIAGRTVGSIGAMSCFSFYPTKNLGALGDGGAVVTNDPILDEKLRRLRQYGWERKYYSTETGGINSRLDELQAAILRIKLQHLPAWNARRQEIADLYSELLSDTGLGLPNAPAGGTHVYHLYVVTTTQRDALQGGLRNQGIGSDIHYPLPAHLQPIYQHLATPGSLPVSERLAGQVLSLPNFPELTNDEVRSVASAVRTVLG
ncbi:MAG: DegT/DnrJ/EryC1/StrS family aminotransferase [Roseiflexaceae bacterium]